MVLFNRYEYNPQADLIGKGGFARVYKALNKDLNAVVAIKIWKTGGALAAPYIPGEQSVPYIPVSDRQELIRLSHPAISRYLAIESMEKEDAFGETETIQVCVLEWADGGTIAQYYAAHKDPAVLEKLLSDAAEGLSYLHKNGMAHLNVKAANILVTMTADGPVAKVADFGIVKNPDMAAQMAYTDDFRALGVVIYELLTGEPIMGTNETEKLPSPFREMVARYLSGDVEVPAVAASADDTQGLTLGSEPVGSADDTKRLDSEEALSDDTQILAPVVKTASNDDTQILVSKPQSVASDDTQILSPKPGPAASDDTQILTPAAKAPASDDTQILSPRSTSSDDTQILAPRPQSAASDDTQILSPKQSPAASDDTQILTPAAKTPASDDTQVLRPRKEELLSLFNRYEYNPNTGLIGKGGFSRVYKAFDKRLNRWVALKIYKGGEFADRYSPIAEIRRVVNLDHSNICRYLDIEEIEKENSFGETEITQICVMELLDGGTFAQYYNTHKDEKVLKKLLNDVLNGLSYLHKNGIVHRDIKPANILIKETIDGPVAKITDFGISKATDSVNNNSSSALIVSIPYMAPEQLNVKKYGINEKISYNLDLWSLGVTVYEVVTGKVLFKNSEQDSSEQIMTNIMAPELPEKIQELSQPFRDIVSHCIVKDAKDRAQKAEELIVLLHGNYEDDPSPVLVIPPVPRAESVPETKSTAKAKKSFFIENEEDEGTAVKTGKSRVEKKNSPPPAAERSQVTNDADRQKRTVFIGIVAGFIVVFLAITFYFVTRNNKEDLSTIPVKKADTATNVSAAPAKTPVQAPVQTPAASTDVQPPPPAKTESVPAQPTSNGGEKKQRKAAANTDNEEVPAASNSNQKYVLILTSTQSCTVKINKEDYGKLEAGKTLKVYLVPGTYVLQATSLSNSASVYSGNLEVTEKNRSQVGQYRIPLP